MVVPQKRTNVTKGFVPETVVSRPPQSLLPPHHVAVSPTTTDGTTTNGDAMRRSTNAGNDDDDDLMTSPSKSFHHKGPQFQKHLFIRRLVMWLTGPHDRTITTNRRKSQQLFIRFTLLLLLLVMLSSIFMAHSTKQLLVVDLMAPSLSHPTKHNTLASTTLPRHRPSKPNSTQMLPRLRKRWIGNPFQSKKNDASNRKPSPPPQHQQQNSPGLVRLWEKLWQQRYRADQQHMQETRERNHNIFQNTNHTITRQDLTDLSNKHHHATTRQTLPHISNRTTTIPSSSSSSSTILDMVQQRMGLQIDSEIASLLPTWEQVTALYGRRPILYGINPHSHHEDVCRTYRNRMKSPTRQRYLGVAGQMNTGTNALARYLLQNIYLPAATTSIVRIDEERTTTTTTVTKKNRPGILWTVPWYKHSWSSLYQQYHYDDHQKTAATATESLPTDHSHVMAIVLIRDPYFWMQSMCGSPYSLEWQRNTAHCPNLFNSESLDMLSSSSSPLNNNAPTEGSQVRIRWGPTGNYIRTWPSLVEMYNDWYNEYVVNAQNISRIIIRFEDLLFHTEYVINAIRECVDAKWIHTTNVTSSTNDENGHETVVVEERPIFQYAVSPAKTHPYFSKYKPPSSYVSALIKYGQDDIEGRNRYGSMTPADIEYAQTHLNPELLRLFHYQINPSSGDERNGQGTQ